MLAAGIIGRLAVRECACVRGAHWRAEHSAYRLHDVKVRVMLARATGGSTHASCISHVLCDVHVPDVLLAADLWVFACMHVCAGSIHVLVLVAYVGLLKQFASRSPRLPAARPYLHGVHVFSAQTAGCWAPGWLAQVQADGVSACKLCMCGTLYDSKWRYSVVQPVDGRALRENVVLYQCCATVTTRHWLWYHIKVQDRRPFAHQMSDMFVKACRPVPELCKYVKP
jgi:hypothetical protein